MFLICWYLQNTIGCHTSKHWIRCEPGRCPHLLFILDLTAIVEPPLEIELLAQYDTIMYGWVVRLVSCTSLLFLSFFLSFVPVSLSLSTSLSLSCVPVSLSLQLSPFLSPSCVPVSLSLSFVPVSFSIQLSPFLSLSLVPVSLSLHPSLPVSLSLYLSRYNTLPVICPCISLPTRLSIPLPVIFHLSLSKHVSHLFFLSFISVSPSLHLSFSPPAIRHQEPHRPCSPHVTCAPLALHNPSCRNWKSRLLFPEPPVRFRTITLDQILKTFPSQTILIMR